jgi:hypothetical protein
LGQVGQEFLRKNYFENLKKKYGYFVKKKVRRKKNELIGFLKVWRIPTKNRPTPQIFETTILTR